MTIIAARAFLCLEVKSFLMESDSYADWDDNVIAVRFFCLWLAYVKPCVFVLLKKVWNSCFCNGKRSIFAENILCYEIGLQR